jgi:N-acetylglucosaminyl-diphospho-decaprenol L-rhamnosyltransferase
MKQLDVAIQIVNYKTRDFLEPLIESVFRDTASSDLKIEINVLDNASGDDLSDIARRWRGKNLHIYATDTNNGFGAGHNLLAGKTRARYLLILNPDLLIIEPRTVERLIARLEKSGAAVVGPRLLTPRARQARELGDLTAGDLKQQPWDHCKRYIGPYQRHDKPVEVAWVSGAVFLIGREQFEAAGGFDEAFFLYYEELDLCRRLRRRGLRVVYDPEVQVLHYGNAVANKFSRYLVKSFLLFLMKGIPPGRGRS